MNCQMPRQDLDERNPRRSLPDRVSIELNRNVSNGIYPGANTRAMPAMQQGNFVAGAALIQKAMCQQTTPFLPGAQNQFFSRPRDLSYTTQDAAKRSVLELLARHNTAIPAIDDDGSLKAPVKILTNFNLPMITKKSAPSSPPLKKRAFGIIDDGEPPIKKSRPEMDTAGIKKTLEEISSMKARVRADFETRAQELAEPTDESKPVSPVEGGAVVDQYNDDDVLCGRGGGTNVHPGNRRFRDLIHAHRCQYLKAKKNDKPAISRSIVASVRRANGRFLKKDEKTGKWIEIGDDGAREKTSQALRQRAPEMRRILFEGEQRMAEEEIRRRGEEAAAAAAADAAVQRAQVAAAAVAPPASTHHGGALSLPVLQAASNTANTTNTSPLATELAKNALLRNVMMRSQQSVIPQPPTPSNVDATTTALLVRRLAMLRGNGMSNLGLHNNP